MEDDHNEEDQTARALLKEKGFDPENVSKVCHLANGWSGTPVMYFIKHGNIKMIRYLLSRDADCRKADIYGHFPMFAAAINGRVEIMKLLYHEGGAQEDIRKVSRSGISSLRMAFYSGHFHAVWWLLLNGALASRDGDGGINDATMRKDFSVTIWDDDKRLPILAWVRDAVAAHDNVQVFLTGTIVPASSFRRHPKNPYATRSKRTKVAPSTLAILKGKSGILELIAHYVSGTPQQRRTLRQLMDRLPVFIADVPFVEVEEEEDEEDEDDYSVGEWV